MDEFKTPPQRNIRELVREGQGVVVQVIKDPIGTKGARLTTDNLAITLFLSICQMSVIGVSQRIEDAEERTRRRH